MKRTTLMLAAALTAAGCDDGGEAGPVVDAAPPADGAPTDAAPTDAEPADAAPPIGRCADFAPERNLYFGDLHVHTAYSFDAWVFDVRNRPEDAYRFARGEAVQLPPVGPDGVGQTTVRLARPLDFAAVTDHAEFLAEIQACTTPGSAAYDSATCIGYRRAEGASVANFGLTLTQPAPTRFNDICGPGRVDCAAGAADVWQRTREAANAAQSDGPTCDFTAFVAYEYSGATGLSNLHRNVLFRGDDVPDLPVTYFDEPTPDGLFKRLESECLDAPGDCDVLAIPHNGNWSNGNLFALTWMGAESIDAQRTQAARRARLEPLVEIMQHKGDSECHPALGDPLGAPDEACRFEKLRPEASDCGEGTGRGAMIGQGCLSRYDFVRGALLRGLAQWKALGINPFELGFIAATDTHNGTPGLVAERDWPGHWGNNEDADAKRLSKGTLTPGGVLFNPGGLAAVWAEENTREALFDALRRREVYGTSGPRIGVRFFGGWGFDAALCDDPALVTRGYAEGVPMGGRLEAAGAGAPRFVISALRDAGAPARPGAPLERVELIKGWVDAEGNLRERVVVVAGAADPDAACQPTGQGADALCGVWTDPDFDPTAPAFYYARVLEVPSCRWSAWACLELNGDDRPAACDDPAVPKTVRERAWTSPIWYLPRGG